MSILASELQTTDMATENRTCDTCGNRYVGGIEIRKNEQSLYFDSFECAIHRLAPRCGKCGMAIIGHGVEADGVTFCCAHCARQTGASGLRDHA
jgi:hypothetical protein